MAKISIRDGVFDEFMGFYPGCIPAEALSRASQEIQELRLFKERLLGTLETVVSGVDPDKTAPGLIKALTSNTASIEPLATEAMNL